MANRRLIASICFATISALSLIAACGSSDDSGNGNVPVPTGKLVFVTSQRFTGNLGGVVGADAICKAAADQSSIAGVHGRIWKAWLSDSDPYSAPFYRFDRKALSDGIITVTSVLVAKNWEDLTTGKYPPGIAIPYYLSSNILNENGDRTLNYVWTNVSTDGTMNSADGKYNCSDWTSERKVNRYGHVGYSGETNNYWTHFYIFPEPGPDQVACSNAESLYCFEQQE